jgi:hypothetical protein
MNQEEVAEDQVRSSCHGGSRRFEKESSIDEMYEESSMTSKRVIQDIDPSESVHTEVRELQISEGGRWQDGNS